ncbi:MAG: FxDxF family PEP-CTERM protein [Duganella sp.]
MKIKKLLVASLVAGATLFGSGAYAAEVGKTATINLEADGDGGFNGHFGNTFAKADQNNTFVDKFLLVLSTNVDSAASLTSTYLKSATIKDLVITDFSLVKYDLATNAVLNTYAGNYLGGGLGARDEWEINASGLTAGNYYVQVGGLIAGNAGGSYASDLTVSVSAVPEAETYAMMLAGLGMLGFVARRKKAQQA